MDGWIYELEQFLVAAKQYGILQLTLIRIPNLPIQFLADFCRDNRNLKVLQLEDLCLVGRATELSFPPDQEEASLDSSPVLALDELHIGAADYNRGAVAFPNPAAVTAFTHLLQRMTYSVLEIGNVSVQDGSQTCCRDTSTEYIVSELFQPSVGQLTIHPDCQLRLYPAALKSGIASVLVNIHCDRRDTTERLKLITGMIRDSVQLQSLALYFNTGCRGYDPPPPFLPALEASASITRLQVNREHMSLLRDPPGFSPDQVLQMRNITARNEELARFEANPSIYPIENWLVLVRCFDNCPTGRYRLARHLPEVFSLETLSQILNARTTTEPTRKKQKTNQPVN